MKANEIVGVLPMICLVISLPALAQQNLVMLSPAIQAIDTHLQQSRIQKQQHKRAAFLLPPQEANAVTPEPKAVKLSNTTAKNDFQDDRNEFIFAINTKD